MIDNTDDSWLDEDIDFFEDTIEELEPLPTRTHPVDEDYKQKLTEENLLSCLDDAASNFIQAFSTLQSIAYDINVYKGWWDKPTDTATEVCMMHSELSEAIEGLRQGKVADDMLTGHYSFVVELADCIIRIMSCCGHRQVDLATPLVDKLYYNLTKRAYRHGNKRF